MCSPQRSSGFSIVNGSWNMSETHLTSAPPSREGPSVRVPGIGRCPRRTHPRGDQAIARAVVMLPEPDSPTMPTVSPAPTSRSVPTVIVRRRVPIPTRSGPGDLQERDVLGHRADIRSYVQSPMMLMLAAVTTIAAAGSRAAIGFVSRIVRFSNSIRPQSGVPGGTPSRGTRGRPGSRGRTRNPARRRRR